MEVMPLLSRKILVEVVVLCVNFPGPDNKEWMMSKRKMVTKRLVALAGLFLLLASTALAELCNGDFDCDGDIDGSDGYNFKQDFGRQDCTNAPALVPKTGQTEKYVDGGDGECQKGVALPNPRFTDNEDGTVTDNLTGLIWLKNANCDGPKTWANALVFANGLASAHVRWCRGLSDKTRNSYVWPVRGGQ